MFTRDEVRGMLEYLDESPFEHVDIANLKRLVAVRAAGPHHRLLGMAALKLGLSEGDVALIHEAVACYDQMCDAFQAHLETSNKVLLPVLAELDKAKTALGEAQGLAETLNQRLGIIEARLQATGSSS